MRLDPLDARLLALLAQEPRMGVMEASRRSASLAAPYRRASTDSSERASCAGGVPTSTRTPWAIR